jgi:selenocysteine lyase/cysteine desulfurase
MSPQLKSVEAAGQKALRKKNNPWQYTGDDFFKDCDEGRELFARLLSANADDIAIIPSVSYGMASVAKNCTLSAGENIVCLDKQFPSNVYSWLRLSQENNGEVRFAEREKNETWLEAVLRTVNAKTKIIAIPEVHWADGRIVDVGAIAKAIAGKDIKLVLDLTQSLGAKHFSIKNCPADFIVAASYKWLLGPYGLSFFYVNPKEQNAVPIEESWINRKDSKNFANLVNYEANYERGARRFDAGQRSQFQLIPMAVEALKFINEIKTENIYSHTENLVNLLAEGAAAQGFEIIPSEERSSHLTGIIFPHELPHTVQEKLQSEKISISIRGNAIRVSPHLYNTKEDIEHFLNCLSL